MGLVPGEGTAPMSPTTLGTVTSSVGNGATGSGSGASIHVLHPQQFSSQLAPAQSSLGRIKSLAAVARGPSGSDIAHSARDHLLSGGVSPEAQVGGSIRTVQ